MSILKAFANKKAPLNMYGNFNSGEGTPVRNDNMPVVLSGGGIDSFIATCVYLTIARPSPINQGAHFVIVNYGQISFEQEYHAVCEQAEYLGGEVHIVQDYSLQEHALSKGISSGEAEAFYIPYRNARFAMLAASVAEQVNAPVIILGSNNMTHPDNSPVTMNAIYNLLRASGKGMPPAIFAPFVLMTKAAVIATMVELEQTLSVFAGLVQKSAEICVSCYSMAATDKKQCGVCPSCRALQDSFYFCGVKDPNTYQGSFAKDASDE